MRYFSLERITQFYFVRINFVYPLPTTIQIILYWWCGAVATMNSIFDFKKVIICIIIDMGFHHRFN